MGQSRILDKMVAVKAMPTAKGVCFSFSKVNTSSEHEKASSREMKSQVLKA